MTEPPPQPTATQPPPTLSAAIAAPTPTPQLSSVVPSTQPTVSSAQATATTLPTPAPTPTPDVYLTPTQATVALDGVKQDYQGWNNCGPTTLRMMLSYYGRNDTQKEIASFTKPDWDDKNVSPSELVAY